MHTLHRVGSFIQRYMSLLLLLLAHTISVGLSADLFDPSLQEVPTAYRGRFRPLASEARLWLYDLYHREQISPSDYPTFHVTSGSAHELLWKMHFLGHTPWKNAPLFHIEDRHLKVLLGFDTATERFSYHQLHYAIDENRESSMHLMRPLLTYFFLKSYRDPANRSRSEKHELSTLEKGLWVMFEGDNIVVAASPRVSPWQFLSPGEVITANVRPSAESYLKQYKRTAEAAVSLFSALHQFRQMGTWDEQALKNAWMALHKHGASRQETAASLEMQFSLFDRLAHADSMLKLLPSKQGRGIWLPIKALKAHVYNPASDQLEPIGNFTLYPDALFEAIRTTYLQIEKHIKQSSASTQGEIEALSHKLSLQLQEGYAALAGTSYQEANGKKLTYPSFSQLHAEAMYDQFFWTIFIVSAYSLAFTLLLLSFKRLGLSCMLAAFGLHTFLLGLRCYILERPPVSNMYETVIYVPWVAVFVSLLLYMRFQKKLLLIASSLASVILLVILQIVALHDGFDNVQAVLDSQYWLMIHVLLVVGSYGAFILCGILGHFFLGAFMMYRQETARMHALGKCLLQCMYLGIAMLIPGTILGGVWAAESWGRFWDWDPKESWAFIAICTYLLGIHAYTFQFIGYFGLAVVAIIGLQVVSFTWYGVNYILGTGLHSYGFGTGGEGYYYLFLITECLFLGLAWVTKWRHERLRLL